MVPKHCKKFTHLHSWLNLCNKFMKMLFSSVLQEKWEKILHFLQPLKNCFFSLTSENGQFIRITFSKKKHQSEIFQFCRRKSFRLSKKNFLMNIWRINFCFDLLWDSNTVPVPYLIAMAPTSTANQISLDSADSLRCMSSFTGCKKNSDYWLEKFPFRILFFRKKKQNTSRRILELVIQLENISIRVALDYVTLACILMRQLFSFMSLWNFDIVFFSYLNSPLINFFLSSWAYSLIDWISWRYFVWVFAFCQPFFANKRFLSLFSIKNPVIVSFHVHFVPLVGFPKKLIFLVHILVVNWILLVFL